MYYKNNFGKDFEEKLRYISEQKDESSKYLYNIYLKYCFSSPKVDTDKYLLSNGCTFKKDILDIVRYCQQEKKVIVEITTIKNDRYFELSKICKQKGIPMVTIDNLKHKINLDDCNDVFLDINIDDINKWYNWDVILENTFYNILNSLDKVSISDLKANTLDEVSKCINCNKNNKYKEEKLGWNVIKFARTIDKLFLMIDKIGISNFANIYIAMMMI